MTFTGLHNSKRRPSASKFLFHQRLLVFDEPAVYASVQELVLRLKDRIPKIRTPYFFSDGGPVHYKNCINFAIFNPSLIKLIRLIKLIAHWFFSGPVHGKIVADAVGGAVKKLARLEAKRRHISNQILMPLDLLYWAKSGL